MCRKVRGLAVGVGLEMLECVVKPSWRRDDSGFEVDLMKHGLFILRNVCMIRRFEV